MAPEPVARSPADLARLVGWAAVPGELPLPPERMVRVPANSEWVGWGLVARIARRAEVDWEAALQRRAGWELVGAAGAGWLPEAEK